MGGVCVAGRFLAWVTAALSSCDTVAKVDSSLPAAAAAGAGGAGGAGKSRCFSADRSSVRGFTPRVRSIHRRAHRPLKLLPRPRGTSEFPGVFSCLWCTRSPAVPANWLPSAGQVSSRAHASICWSVYLRACLFSGPTQQFDKINDLKYKPSPWTG